MDFSSSILTSKLKKSGGGPLPRWCRWSGTRGATLEKNRQLWGQSVKPEALAKHADRFSGDVITKCRPHVLWLELNWWVQLVLTFPSWHCIGQEEPKSCKRKKPHPKGGESQLFKDVIFSSEGQGGKTWQAFGGGKNGHETFRQAPIYNFRDKCNVFTRNLKFSNLTQ